MLIAVQLQLQMIGVFSRLILREHRNRLALTDSFQSMYVREGVFFCYKSNHLLSYTEKI